MTDDSEIAHQGEFLTKQNQPPTSDFISQLTKEHQKVIIKLQQEKQNIENELS